MVGSSVAVCHPTQAVFQQPEMNVVPCAWQRRGSAESTVLCASSSAVRKAGLSGLLLHEDGSDAQTSAWSGPRAAFPWHHAGVTAPFLPSVVPSSKVMQPCAFWLDLGRAQEIKNKLEAAILGRVCVCRGVFCLTAVITCS